LLLEAIWEFVAARVHKRFMVTRGSQCYHFGVVASHETLNLRSSVSLDVVPQGSIMDEGGDNDINDINGNENHLDEADETDRPAAFPVLETGRSAIQPASEASRNYLSTLRWTVLKFINLFNSKLDQAKEGTTLYSLSVSSGVRVRLNKIYNCINY
jgi:hypothetical protein